MLSPPTLVLKNFFHQICADLCPGSPYYGTQYGFECWCGSDDEFDRHGPGVCDIPCVGNEDEVCGGDFAISVYPNEGAIDDTTVTVETDDVEDDFLGCFGDDQNARIFPVARVLGNPDMTSAVRLVESLFSLS